ncbi:MAG: FAD:protein FMN transferase [Planctomycetota bacterium]
MTPRTVPVFSRLALALVFAACGGPPVVHEFGGPTMGSTYWVKYVAAAPLPAVSAAVAEELAATDAAFSDWRADSEIRRVNAHAGVDPLPLSPRFAGVLRLALAMAQATDGAFDPTVKPLSDLYRAAKADPQHRLDAEALAAAKERVDWRRVTLRDSALVKARPDVQLDLDGIVAGAACDAIAARLRALGVEAFYLQITGEVLCSGRKPDGEPWRIGVVDPSADQMGDETPIRTLSLRDRALCTSGDYLNALVVDGGRFHHVFDPRTGRNPTTDVVSASVLADSAAIADALGTAFLVLGADGAQAIWPRLVAFGVRGALLLSPGPGGALKQFEIAWPKEDA